MMVLGSILHDIKRLRLQELNLLKFHHNINQIMPTYITPLALCKYDVTNESAELKCCDCLCSHFTGAEPTIILIFQYLY